MISYPEIELNLTLHGLSSRAKHNLLQSHNILFFFKGKIYEASYVCYFRKWKEYKPFISVLSR